MKQLFCSRDIACKSPYGAVCVGEIVTFRLYPTRKRGITEASLFIAEDGNEREQHQISMEWNGLVGAHDCYYAEYCVPRSGLYWYYFRVRAKSGVYYISRGRGGVGVASMELTNRFQLTVMESDYHTPTWFGEGITYNIFPDRFCRLETPAKDGYPAARVIHENWEETPEYRPNTQGEILNNDFFGGSLRGIQSKLPYLASLHVRTLYFNPIFEAYSNHRYDTGNYKKIDPMLGTEEDFKALCTEAERYGMRVMLDGVFNHTGNDSLYFNARGHYDSVGAYQSKESPYAAWYDFQQWPDRYSSWWGIYTLPQVNETCPDYLNYIIEDEDSVIRHWLRAGASGWRLDVADELPDSFIAKLNAAAHDTKPDALVLGEVWEDASNKIAYDVRRRYFSGGELDSVMNYPLREAILAFVGGGDAADFMETMETIRENYPRDIFYNLMNIIGTHDTPRILSVLGSEAWIWNAGRDERAQYRLSDTEYARASQRLRLAAALQFTMPGSPCIYYGDEVGMQGYEDPFNRRTFPWGGGDQEILNFYRALGTLRDESEALHHGSLRFIHAEGGLLAYVRQSERECLTVLVNRSEEPVSLRLPYMAAYDVLTEEELLEPSGEGVSVPVRGIGARILRCAGAEQEEAKAWI